MDELLVTQLGKLIETITNLAPEIWNVYIKQAIFLGWVLLAVSISTASCSIFLIRWGVRGKKDYDETIVALSVLGGVIMIFVTVVTLVFGVNRLLNPEYFAIQDIMNSIISR